MEETTYLMYAAGLVIQSGIIMGIAYWVAGTTLASAAYIAAGVAVASFVLPPVLRILVGTVVIFIAGVVSTLHPPLEASNGYQYAA